MKRTALLVSFVAVLALSASAQTLIDFSQMPKVSAPAPMPDNYAGCGYMDWDQFLYVTPTLWKDRGPGFAAGTAQHINATFIGGPFSSTPFPFGSIKLAPVLPTAPKYFQPISITLSAGWVPNTVRVVAYNSKGWSGTVTWSLGLKPQTFKFPATWTNVTELVFTPNLPILGNPVASHQPGSMVVYSFLLVKR